MTILRRVRMKYNKSREEMAKELGVNYYTYRSYEQGLRVLPPKILKKVLLLRGEKEDKKLAEILEEVYK